MHLERQHIVHRRRAIIVVSARLRDARNQVVQVQRHDLVIDVYVPCIWSQNLQSRASLSRFASTPCMLVQHKAGMQSH